ncbi:MAG: ATP-binding protein [Planctomycetaceae bacterium]
MHPHDDFEARAAQIKSKCPLAGTDVPHGVTAVSGTLEAIHAKMRARLAKSSMTPEQLAEANRKRLAALDAEMHFASTPEGRFASVVGKAYARLRLSNFQTTDLNGVTIPRAVEVLRVLQGMADHISDAIKANRQLVLYGRPGAGKDHLVAGLLWEAQQAGHSIKWLNGERFAALVRDQQDFNNHQSVTELIRQWVTPAVLVISDPDGEATKIPDSVKQRLYDVIDARIRQGKPVWVTINGNSEQDISNRLGARIYDRLRQGAWILHCDWASRRTPRGTV